MRSESEMIEAMKQALKYTKQGALVPVDVPTTKLLVDALRAALAEDAMQRLTDVQKEMEATSQESRQVEPVAWLHEWDGTALLNTVPPDYYGDHWKHTALYTAPPKREPLTDAEIKRLYDSLPSKYTLAMFARAVERAHGIGGEE